jgi:hypothetical protein
MQEYELPLKKILGNSKLRRRHEKRAREISLALV